MIDALYNGISGLNGYQTALNTESNNIANINTVAFKADKISFADMMYQNAKGRGVSVETIDKNFYQGNLKITSGDYDMAINGNGFFVVQGDTEEKFYTRAGNFRMAEDGTLQTVNGYNVKGVVNDGDFQVKTTDSNNTMFTSDYNSFLASTIVKSNEGKTIESINAKATSYTTSATDDPYTKSGDGYKTKQAKIADVEALGVEYRNELKAYSVNPTAGTPATSQVSNIKYDMSKINSELNSIEVVVGTTQYIQDFDKDAQTTLKKLADQISNTKALTATADADGNLQITYMIPGKEINVSNTKILEGIDPILPAPSIDTTAPQIGSGKARLDSIETALKDSIENADAKFLRITSTIDSSDSTTELNDIQLKLDKLGLSDSPFGNVELDNGVIYISQADNRFAVGKVGTVQFSNILGLEPSGDNLFAQTTTSGEPISSINTTNVLGKTLELSNTELGESLVNLMVYQRAFEANSKSVTTSDEFLKTALALKT